MMMTNLFSIFDPTMSVFSISYGTPLICVLLLPSFYWMVSSVKEFFSKFLLTLITEVNYTIQTPTKGIYLLIGSIFMLIFSMNFLSLFPHLFSMTSHLTSNFPLSFSFWVGVVVFGWVKSFSDFLCHLVPNGTPLGLVSFMALVELLSNFIRPLALTFRLTANMMAGHLLMSLIGGAMLSLPFTGVAVMIPVQSLLVTMELGVSLIQAYVFTTLTLLYISETH